MRVALRLRRNLAHTVALVGIGVAAAASTTTLTVIKPEYGAGLAAVMLPFAGRQAWHTLAHHPFSRVVGLFAVYVVLQILYLHAHGGGTLQYLSTPMSKPVKLGFLGVVVGTWLCLYPAMTRTVLNLMLAGFVVQSVLGLIQTGPALLLSDHVRLTIGYPANLGAMFFGMATVATLLAAIDASGERRRWNTTRFRVVGYAACFVFFVICLVLSGSRGAWLATIMATPFVVFFYLRHRRGAGAGRAHKPGWHAISLGVVLAIVVATGAYRMAATGRLQGFVQIAGDFLSGHVANIPMSSVGIRLHLLDYGLHLFARHPLLGQGLAAIAGLIQETDIRAGSFVPAHMHDAYLQALVGFGAIGSGLMIWGAVVLIRGARANFRRDAGRPLEYWVLAAMGTVAAVANLFDSLAWRLVEARIPLELLLGCAFALSLRASGVLQPSSHSIAPGGAAPEDVEEADPAACVRPVDQPATRNTPIATSRHDVQHPPPTDYPGIRGRSS